MAQQEVTYNDKSDNVAPVNPDRQVTAANMNELKNVVTANAQDVEARLKEYPFTFENSNLVAGVLAVNHDLNTEFPKLTLKRPDGTFEETTNIMVYVDENNINLDFGGDIEAGTWNGLVTYR
jgi:hypothetical protein